MGVHDASEDVLPSDQLPLANLMYPVTAGGGQGGSFKSANLRQGMFVFGFYMDGQDMQVPVIMGVLGNNAQTELETKIGEGDSNFDPTSGFDLGQEDIKGPAKSTPMDEGKSISKPKDAETSNEEAALSGVVDTNSFGIPLNKAAIKEFAGVDEDAGFIEGLKQAFSPEIIKSPTFMFKGDRIYLLSPSS